MVRVLFLPADFSRTESSISDCARGITKIPLDGTLYPSPPMAVEVKGPLVVELAPCNTACRHIGMRASNDPAN